MFLHVAQMHLPRAPFARAEFGRYEDNQIKVIEGQSQTQIVYTGCGVVPNMHIQGIF